MFGSSIERKVIRNRHNNKKNGDYVDELLRFSDGDILLIVLMIT